MRTSRVKAKLRRNDPVLVTALHFNDPVVYEMTSLMGFDCLWLDMEHQSRSMQTAGQLVRGARVGTSDVMIRIAKGDFLRMGRALEIGAQGIMYPRCDNADEAREVVKWAKFAPQGTRGVDSAGADNPYCMMPLGDYLKQANDETFLVVQIEDPAALENVEAMAAVDGVDVLFFGPGDFSILAGVPGQWYHPLVADAMKRVSAAAKKAGKQWGMPVFNPEFCRKVLDLGGRFLANGSDITNLKTSFETLRSQFQTLGVTFETRST